MKSTTIAIAALLLVAGCTTKLDGVNEPSRKEEGGDGIDGKVLCTAMVFPDGYDWRLDFSQDGRLILLADSEIRCEIANPDPWNGHLLVDGKIYEESSGGGFTRILCNGEEILRWKGEENIWDMALDKSHLFCICTGDKGTVFREDGQIVHEIDGYWPDSGFYVDEKQLCFDLNGEKAAYVQGKQLVMVDWLRLRMYTRGHPHCANGQICYYSDDRCGTPDKMVSSMAREHILGLLHDDGDLFVEYLDSKGIYKIMTLNKKVLYSSEQAFDRKAVAIDGDDIWALGQLKDGSWAVFHEGRFVLLPTEVHPRSSCRLCLKYGRLLFPVTCADGSAGVWDSGKIVNLGFNGYVQNISIGRGSSKLFCLSW